MVENPAGVREDMGTGKLVPGEYPGIPIAWPAGEVRVRRVGGSLGKTIWKGESKRIVISKTGIRTSVEHIGPKRIKARCGEEIALFPKTAGGGTGAVRRHKSRKGSKGV